MNRLPSVPLNPIEGSAESAPDDQVRLGGPMPRLRANPGPSTVRVDRSGVAPANARGQPRSLACLRARAWTAKAPSARTTDDRQRA
jgi:hypothetical protein